MVKVVNLDTFLHCVTKSRILTVVTMHYDQFPNIMLSEVLFYQAFPGVLTWGVSEMSFPAATFMCCRLWQVVALVTEN